VLVAGDGADDIGKQSGGWTVTWQGTGNSNADFPGATSIYGGIRKAVEAAGGKATLSVDGSFKSKPDVAIVVFGENPYAEWQGDVPVVDRAAHYRSDPAPVPEASALNAMCSDRGKESEHGKEPSSAGRLESKELLLFRSLKKRGVPVVAVFLTGRPLFITPELEASDAFVVGWLPGTEGAGIADVLFRKPDGSVNYNFNGKLSYSWPRNPTDTTLNKGDTTYSPLFPYGFGLTYQ